MFLFQTSLSVKGNSEMACFKLDEFLMNIFFFSIPFFFFFWTSACATWAGIQFTQYLYPYNLLGSVFGEIYFSFSVLAYCSRARFLLPKSCLKALYYCLVYPYLHYCIIVWGSTYKTSLRRLVSLQYELSELFLNQFSILIQTLFSKK